MPIYKDPRYLIQAIRSVLEQSFADWELIIIDDGLTNNAKQIVLDFIKYKQKIQLVSSPQNCGIQKSLNKGLSIASGKYIARIDDDDFWIDKDKLKIQVEFLDNNPDYVLVGTDAIICNEKFRDLQTYSMPKSDWEIKNRILFKNCFLHSTVLMKRSALDEIGRYSESKKVHTIEDYDLWLKLGGVGKLANLDFRSARLIVHSNSITAKNRLKQSWGDIGLTIRYRKKYNHFFFALAMGCLRVIFWSINIIVPFPERVLYKIQAMYKAI